MLTKWWTYSSQQKTTNSHKLLNYGVWFTGTVVWKQMDNTTVSEGTSLQMEHSVRQTKQTDMCMNSKHGVVSKHWRANYTNVSCLFFKYCHRWSKIQWILFLVLCWICCILLLFFFFIHHIFVEVGLMDLWWKMFDCKFSFKKTEPLF